MFIRFIFCFFDKQTSFVDLNENNKSTSVSGDVSYTLFEHKMCNLP